MAEFVRGLEGVVADQSRICKINAKPAGLYYMGYSVEQLAEACTFLEVAYLLLREHLPTSEQLHVFESQVKQLRRLPPEIVNMIKSFPATENPMSVLQAVVAALGVYHTDVEHQNSSEVIYTLTSLIAQFPSIVGTFYRYQKNLPDLPDDASLDYASYFLYLITGKKPTEKTARVFDQCLILHAEHSSNASTFTARVVASTLATIHASVSAAVGALSGPLHGGANEHAVLMAEDIADPSKANTWVTTQLDHKNKIFGFGHRVYRDIDPRAKVLERLYEDIEIPPATRKKFETLKAVRDVMAEIMAQKGKEIYPNVDLFSGTLYEAMGIPIEIYTTVFAISRMSGWGAHIVELWKDNRLYRPKLQYVGEMHESVPEITKR